MKKIHFKKDAAASFGSTWFRLMGSALCALSFVACAKTEVTQDPDDPGATQLATPEVTVSGVTAVSATISWAEIEGAGSYQVVVTDPEGTAVYDNTIEGQTDASVQGLSAGTAYKAACTALPADPELYSQSETGYVEFTTAEEAPQEQSFEITVSNVTSSTANVTVIPAIKDQYYKIIAFREDLPDDVVLKMMIDDMNLYVDAKGWDQAVADGLFFIGDTIDCMFDQFPDGYDARFFVVGVDYVDGAVVATTPLFKSEKFTTVEIVESEAWVNMTPFSTFVDGQLVLGVQLYPNEPVKEIKAAAWSVYTGYGDPSSLAESGYTEAGIRGALLSDSATDVSLDNPNFASYAMEGFALLFGVIGIDETGTPGNTNWIILKAVDAEGNYSVLCESEDNESGIEVVVPDMTIEYSFADAGTEYPGYDGCPLLMLTFTPNELCADYHYSIEVPGTFDAYGEYGSVSYLMDPSMKWDPIFQEGWKERADTKDESGAVTDKGTHIFMPYDKGTEKELMYVCIGADGTPSDAQCLTLEIPVELGSSSVMSGRNAAGSGLSSYNILAVMENSPKAHFGL